MGRPRASRCAFVRCGKVGVGVVPRLGGARSSSVRWQISAWHPSVPVGEARAKEGRRAKSARIEKCIVKE
jgi:hypothetical protein